MENITIGNIAAGVAIVVGNAIGLKWLRSDLNHIKRVNDQHREDIKELYTKSDNTMSKREIAELVKQFVEPMKEGLKETKDTMSSINTTVGKMSETVARMDERMLARRSED